MKHPSLKQEPADLIGPSWVKPSGPALESRNPAHPSRVVWSGTTSTSHADAAVWAARDALPAWSAWPIERRFAVLRRFQKLAGERVDALTAIIRDETGKATWDSRAEAQLLGNKVDITLDVSPGSPMSRVSGFELKLGETRSGKAWFRPHGVMAVLGPFNFPAHLPNGHIVPALAMGNTIVFKPSDKTPGVGQALAELLIESLDAEGAPTGVVNLVQGGADVASALVRHDEIDGILFTGSWPVGRRIMEANLDRPGRILALEMGGNNAAVIMPSADLKQAVIECVRSAFVTTGQRCTCTRRLIVHKDVADKVIPAIAKAASNLVIADPEASHPVFMGPVISAQARRSILDAQARLAKDGGEIVMACQNFELPGAATPGGWYITPGIMKVDRFTLEQNKAGSDTEIFGPFLRVSVVDSLDDAMAQANATSYGLAASVFSTNAAEIEHFLNHARAGCVNVNTGTAGASSKLPFGGLGHSGNHRPAGAFSLDYCAYPVAGMIEQGSASTMPAGMRFEDGWLG